MITVDRVRSLAEEKIGESDMFIVDISVKPGNKIEVLVDRDSGLTIDDCKYLSRFIENGLDREVEDFSLDVSSPGVGKPLKVIRQYNKNIGRTVEVELLDGNKFEGELTASSDLDFDVLSKVKEEVPGKKTKKWVDKVIKTEYSQVKETKVVISFK